MPTTPTKGIVVAFGNTPQANDDSFNFNALDTDNDGTVTLDVMANDLGGAAKSLYSIDNALGGYADLLTRDAAGVAEHTMLNNDIAIVNGKVVLTETDAFKAYLATIDDTSQVVDHFDYAIQLGGGALAHADAQVTFAGTHHVGQLLQNWSFEEGQGNTSGGAWQTVNPVPSWTIAGDSAPIEEVSAGYYGTGGDGHFVDGEASPGGVHLIQQADVITGHAAVLGISLAAQNVGGLVTDPTQHVHVAFNGTDVLDITGAQILADAGSYGVFHEYYANVVGAAGIDQVDIQVTGQPNNVGPAVDWVSLIA